MKTYLWKSMCAGLKSAHGNKKWKIGKWYKIKGELNLGFIGKK